MTPSVEELRAQYEHHKAQERLHREMADGYMKSMQLACAHPIESLIEARHQSWGDTADPPFRVCRVCGFAEKGWGCGYHVLGLNIHSGIPELSRDDAYKLVLGRVHEHNETIGGNRK